MEETSQELGNVKRTHEEDIVFLNRKVDSQNGPLKIALDNAKRESEALIREIGRTQDINRLMLAEQIMARRATTPTSNDAPPITPPEIKTVLPRQGPARA